MVKKYRSVKEYKTYQNYMDFVRENSSWLIARQDKNCEKLAFSVLETGRFIVNPLSNPIHCGHGGYLLLLSHGGNGLLRYDDEPYSLPKDTLVLLDCSKPYELTYAKNAQPDWDFFWIRFQGQSCELLSESILASGPLVSSVQNPGELQRKFEHVLDILHYPGTDTLFRLSHSVSSIMDSLIEQSLLRSSKYVRHQETIAQAVAYIHHNSGSPLDIDLLASHAGLSKYYFIKLFKEYMNVAPYEYVITHRINEAKKFLRSTSLKVSQISEAVGFNDECNFIRTFKRITGQTPLQYRDKQR